MSFINVELEKKAIVSQIKLPGLEDNKSVFIKREDLIHKEISGNKWRKLKYNLIEASGLDKKSILTFGGAYSNHIYATAAAGKEYGFKTIGIIRGEEYSVLNPTLKFASDCGMQLKYLNRETYKSRNDKNLQEKLLIEYNDPYLIPEGGSNSLAVKGCSEIINDIDIDYDYICCACGTGGTLAGIVAGLNGNKKALSFSVLKNGSFLINDVKNLIKSYNGKTYKNWDINLNYHFGGYAKINFELLSFINEFERLNNIKLDPIYTGKLMFGVFDLIKNGFFKKEEKILVIHTGGIQGVYGMKNKINKMQSLHSSGSLNNE